MRTSEEKKKSLKFLKIFPAAHSLFSFPGMADLILDGLHSVTGMCDWCGQECDPTAHDLNALDCSFKDCPPSVYHQECLEKFFKTNRLDK